MGIGDLFGFRVNVGMTPCPLSEIERKKYSQIENIFLPRCKEGRSEALRSTDYKEGLLSIGIRMS